MRKITIDNFFDYTTGDWTECSLTLPNDHYHFGEFLCESKTSQYFTDEHGKYIIRISDHWGSGIATCNWYLKGYERKNSYNWSEGKRAGIIALSDLKDIFLEDSEKEYFNTPK